MVTQSVDIAVPSDTQAIPRVAVAFDSDAGYTSPMSRVAILHFSSPLGVDSSNNWATLAWVFAVLVLGNLVKRSVCCGPPVSLSAANVCSYNCIGRCLDPLESTKGVIVCAN